MQKISSITPSIYEIIHFESIFQKFFTYFKVLDKPTKGPVHLDLFRPSVIRGPWSNKQIDITFT